MKRQTVLFAAFCTIACLSMLIPTASLRAADGGSPDSLDNIGKAEGMRIKQAYPAIIPDFAAIEPGARPRDGVTCETAPCEIIVYSNSGGTSATVFGDQGGVPLYDDITMIGQDRFICAISLIVGGINNGGGVIPMTITIRNGNLNPDCPDSPNSIILFQTDVDLPLTNPFNVITVSFNPPVFIDADFLWVGLSTAAELGDNEAAWSIAGPAEVGSTSDLFVIPNGNGVCTFGAGGDYFFFGGSPIAGMGIQIVANPGPPGACCLRDVDAGGGNAQCDDGVVRSACLVSTVNVWKQGECDDFGSDPPCTLCISDTQACAGASLEGEANCTPGYRDLFNQGCLEAPFSFSPISVPGVVCGTSGNYASYCTTNSQCGSGATCDVPTETCTAINARDNDWYRFVLTQDTEVTVRATARFAHEISLMNNGGVNASINCPTAVTAFLDFDRGPACSEIGFTRCLPPGEWIIRYRPDVFAGIPCGTKYRIELTAASCSLVTGACCDTSMAGCTNLAQIACTGRNGVYQGDGTTCAVEGLACPGVPANDTCTTAIQLSGVSVSVTYDSSFANNTHMAYHTSGPPDVPDVCAVGQPAGPAPAIVADVYYRYQIPTIFDGNPQNDGDLVISGVGSTYNSWIVVYGDPSTTNPCNTSLCSRAQVACNQFALNVPTVPGKVNGDAHLVLPVQAGSPTLFGPGDCIVIRVGGTGAAPTGRGPGRLNIDFIPRSAPYTLDTGRCCFDNGTCTISLTEAACMGVGGRPRGRTDFNQGDPLAPTEPTAGCAATPCPGPGQACFTALDFNALVGSSGTITRAVNHVLYFKYELPASGGVVIDTCGSAGNTKMAAYSSVENSPGQGELHGDCDLASLLAVNDNCTVTSSSADGALATSSCYGGLNATFDSCFCLQVGSSPDLQPGNIIYIAIGGPGTSGGAPMFGDSPRHIFDPVLSDFAGTLTYRLNITTVSNCFACSATCPGGAQQEGADAICADTSDPAPQDQWNGGCSTSPPAFNGPSIDCSSGPVLICGTAGNYRRPFPCDNALDCPNNAPCSGPGGFCIGATPFVARDQDWYRITVDQPSVIRWRVVAAEFAAQLDIFSDPDDDCAGLFVFASGDVEFACEPPTGTPSNLEVSASVCAGTYYLRITPAVFGGLGETSCNAEYVVEASCQPFVQLATCCPGDMNADGKVNGLDIQKWITSLFAPPTAFDSFLGCFAANYCRADVNNDGLIDLSDLPDFVDLLVTVNKPVCTLGADCSDPATSQQPFDSTGVTVSDLDNLADARAAECFRPSESGQITTVCWWGTYLTLAGSACPAEPDCFQITFYQPRSGCSPGLDNRCPSLSVIGPGKQYVADVTRVASGGIIVPAGIVTEFFYTATLPTPISVVAGQCYWMEILNNTPPNDVTGCLWNWEQSPQGDTRHAWINGNSPPGGMPTNYNDCTVRTRDLAFSLNLRIAKDGCSKPLGRCCYDPLPLGGVICATTTEDDCVYLRNGQWSDGGTCTPINPPCVVGRCCYLDGFGDTQCASTVQSACIAAGGLWTEAASCPCPTGRCCVGNICSDNRTEISCLAEGGIWGQGQTCSSPCPTGICNNIGRCQLPHVVSGLQQGAYVSDDDDLITVADDFRPVFTSGLNYVDQICFRGFHRQGTLDCSPLAESETFRITYYGTSGNLPNTSVIIGGPFNVTPLKSQPVPSEGVVGGSIQYQYEAFHTPVPVTANQCYWVEIVNTTPNAACVFLWSTSNEGGNLRAAIRKTGGANAFPYQMVDRDLSFCLGPVNLTSTSCPFTAPAAPPNNQCLNATLLGTGPVANVLGTTIGATKEPNAATGCGESATAADVYYLWNQGPVARTTVFTLCSLDTTFDTVIGVHRTTGTNVPPGGCPPTGVTLAAALGGCNEDSNACPATFGSNVLFFQGRQSRVQIGAANLPANGQFLIRITGTAKGGPSNNPPNGHFRLNITQ